METHEEKRSSPRHKYAHRQWLAPIVQDEMPSPAKFVSVVFEDLSCGGVTFCMDVKPQFHECVLALGRAHDLVYLCAKVAHCEQVERNGQPIVRVGCQFTGRAELDQATGHIAKTPDRSPAEDDSNTEAVDALSGRP
ncbi:MAG: hypothetical protein ACC628_00930 [Pirellulaceae bacterium]